MPLSFNGNNLSILIPNHNEPNINEMLVATEAAFPSAEIIVCTDRMSQGKGWALRQAMLHCKGEYVCFIDGDLDIHPVEIFKLILKMRLEDLDIVLGCKEVNSLMLSRKILTMLSRQYIKLLFGFSYDTQTGIKIFKKSAVPYWQTNSYAFDLEVIGRAKRLGLKIGEVPIKVTQKGLSGKKMKLINIIRSLIDSIRIWIYIRQ